MADGALDERVTCAQFMIAARNQRRLAWSETHRGRQSRDGGLELRSVSPHDLLLLLHVQEQAKRREGAHCIDAQQGV